MAATPDSVDANALFEELVERVGTRLSLFLAQLVRDRELAQDLVQDTLLTAYSHRDRLAQISNDEAWLFAIARNRALNATRRRQRGRRALQRLLLNRSEAVADPADAAATRDLLERYLDPNDRALLILRYLHGFDSQELGEVFGMTPEAIRQRLSRLRRRLSLAADPVVAATEERRPQGPKLRRYDGCSQDELETDRAFQRLLAPLAQVAPALARPLTGRRRLWRARRHP